MAASVHRDGEVGSMGRCTAHELERAPGRLNCDLRSTLFVLKSKQRSQQPASGRPNRRRRLPSMPAAC